MCVLAFDKFIHTCCAIIYEQYKEGGGLMIEMVYSGKESESQDDVRIPKNIRQIGISKSNKKVYIEDYVMTQLKSKPQNEENIKYGVLLGDVKRNSGKIYVFVKGMVEVREIIENSLIFNDEIWSDIYKKIKQYFEGQDIVGWFVSVPYRVSDDMNGIRKVHLDNFAGNEKVCFLSDRTENEEGFYFYEHGNLEKQQGYYIYYEKNEKMKKYVKNANNVNTTKSNQNQNSNNKVEAKKQKNVEKEQNSGLQVPASNKEPERKSFRELLNSENRATPRQGRVAYGISALLIVALLLSTVVMLNNYGELKNIKQTLVGINSNNEAQAVNEILGSYSQTTTVNEKVTNNETTEIASEIITEKITEEITEEVMETVTEEVTKVQETVPETEESVASSISGNYHTVKSGQTLYDISMKYYGTSQMVDEIKEANDIDDNYTIMEGQKLLLP